jgi:probable F420-dependent oxidoreductase
MTCTLGMHLRTMGPQSTRDTILGCAHAAEAGGIDELWVGDHIAIPPDDAEGSGGRYLDPLTTLAYLAGATERIRLATGVLVLPYRPPLPTAKVVATIQELSPHRLILGVGAGWMEAEFRAVGVRFAERGRVTDHTLEFLTRCFAADEAESNGQPFLFLPRPPRPPIIVGGAAPHALRRAVRWGEGWMPMVLDAGPLRDPIAQLRRDFADAGKAPPRVIVLTSFPLGDPPAAIDRARAFLDVGVTGLVHGARYLDAAAWQRDVETLATHVRPALAG